MPSKRSCFNKTLFRKNLSRTWPLWGLLSVAGAMVPLYFLLELLRYPAASLESREFAIGLYQMAAYFVPCFTGVYAILCAMLVWGYLYSARSVGLMHTLPVNRTCLFITNTLSGLAMILIPFAVTGGLLCLLALAWGFFDLVAVVNTVLAVLFCTLLFFGMGTLCAMLTGHIFALPVFYLLANFLSFLLEALTTSLAQEFLLGVGMVREIGMLGFLSPVVQIYNSVRLYYQRLPDGTLGECRFVGLWVLALYALAGLAMLALAWFLYRKRHSESAGDVVAFRWLRPVFRYGVALLGGLTIGRLLFEVFWAPLFQRGYYADRIPMGVCAFLGGLVGYYIASMLLEKSLRVFRGSWKGALIVLAGAAAVCLLVSVDLFGLERRVPPMEEIESVSLRDRGLESGPYTVKDAPETVDRLRQLHQAIVDDRQYIRSYTPDFSYEEGKVFSHFVRLSYRLKDGSILERGYDLWLTRERVGTPGTYDHLLSEFYQDPTVRARDVAIPEGAELDSIDIYCDYMKDFYCNTTDHAGGVNTETRAIYDALQKDAQEGNVPARDVLRFSNQSHQLYLQLQYRLYDAQEGAYYGGCNSIYLSPSMTNTLHTLVKLGYLTEAELTVWREALEREDREMREAVMAEQSVVHPEESMVYAG